MRCDSILPWEALAQLRCRWTQSIPVDPFWCWDQPWARAWGAWSARGTKCICYIRSKDNVWTQNAHCSSCCKIGPWSHRRAACTARLDLRQGRTWLQSVERRWQNATTAVASCCARFRERLVENPCAFTRTRTHAVFHEYGRRVLSATMKSATRKLAGRTPALLCTCSAW